jgi:hypothetical protein
VKDVVGRLVLEDFLNVTPSAIMQEIRNVSRERESSEQFVWLHHTHRELETQLTRSGIAPSILSFESRRIDLGGLFTRALPRQVGIGPGFAGRLLGCSLRGRDGLKEIGRELQHRG